jgi:hypothetical protein
MFFVCISLCFFRVMFWVGFKAVEIWTIAITFIREEELSATSQRVRPTVSPSGNTVVRWHPGTAIFHYDVVRLGGHDSDLWTRM